jgi:hypothetical protein
MLPFPKFPFIVTGLLTQYSATEHIQKHTHPIPQNDLARKGKARKTLFVNELGAVNVVCLK